MSIGAIPPHNTPPRFTKYSDSLWKSLSESAAILPSFATQDGWCSDELLGRQKLVHLVSSDFTSVPRELMQQLASPVQYAKSTEPITFAEALGKWVNRIAVVRDGCYLSHLRFMEACSGNTTPGEPYACPAAGKILEVMFTIYDGLCNNLTNLIRLNKKETLDPKYSLGSRLQELPAIILQFEKSIKTIISQIENSDTLKFLHDRLFNSSSIVRGARIRAKELGITEAEQAKSLGFRDSFTVPASLAGASSSPAVSSKGGRDSVFPTVGDFVDEMRGCTNTVDKLALLVTNPEKEKPEARGNFLRLQALFANMDPAFSVPSPVLTPAVKIEKQEYSLAESYKTGTGNVLHSLLLKASAGQTIDDETLSTLREHKAAIIQSIITRLRGTRTSQGFNLDKMKENIRNHQFDKIVDFLVKL